MILLGRLSLYGQGAERLHEVLIAIDRALDGARARKAPLARLRA